MLDTAGPRLARVAALRALALAAVALLVAGCGYHQDVPHLPGGVHTLAVQHINNLTDTGELDTRLRVLLQERLAQQAHVELVTVPRSALGLSIDLTHFTVGRALDPALTSQRTYTYTVTGLVTLTDLRTGHKYANDRQITASVTRYYSPNLLETPAILDDGINASLEAFADQVQQVIERTF